MIVLWPTLLARSLFPLKTGRPVSLSYTIAPPPIADLEAFRGARPGPVVENTKKGN